ncbi:pilin [Patescibacteria group bacterium]|nr:pilin [Patescibacteria group bacterium]
MKNKFYKKLSVFILLVIGGVLLFSFLFTERAMAQIRYNCSCVQGQQTSFTESYPYSSPQQYCEYWCAAYGGMSLLSQEAETCQQCCCNDGTFTSGTQNIDCPDYCSGHEGVQFWGDYDCGSSPSFCGLSDTGPGPEDPGPGPVPQVPQTRIGNVVMPNFLSCSSVSTCITNIANFIINFIAMPLAVFMIILAGFRFVLAQGNDEKLQVARKNFIWTAIGVGIVFASNILIIYIQELLGGSQGGTLTGFINRLKGTLNLVIGVLFSLATAYFIWGIIQYVVSGGDEKKLEQGKKHMVWGIIGMAIMGAAWGIVTMIKNYIGT